VHCETIAPGAGRQKKGFHHEGTKNTKGFTKKNAGVIAFQAHPNLVASALLGEILRVLRVFVVDLFSSPWRGRVSPVTWALK
jgi:hypothetical protein